MKAILRNKWISLTAVLMLGISIGWIVKPSTGSLDKPVQAGAAASVDNQRWTCAMHPQIRQDHPGNCPICGMVLVPLDNLGDEGTSADAESEISMSEASMKIAGVQTSLVHRGDPVRKVYMPGKIKADERRVAVITARFPGRIEKLFVSFTGQQVASGQKLATVYSPELVTAQKELFEAKKYEESNPAFYQAALSKLKRWGLTARQIDAVIAQGEPQVYLDVLAPESGTVTDRIVSVGDYVNEGTILFAITDLRHVWVTFDAYENDLSWIHVGDHVEFSLSAVPGRKFGGAITFIDPVINPLTRVAGVRVEMANADRQLKPDMLVTGTVAARLPSLRNAFMIPKTAVLWTGKRAVVYLKKPGTDHVFSYREIELGPEAGDSYVVQAGLQEGEEVATNGVFKIDAAAQLAGKRSMMNPEAGAMHNQHEHAGMDLQQ